MPAEHTPSQAPGKTQRSAIGSFLVIASVLAAALVAMLVMQVVQGGDASSGPVAKVTSYGEVVAQLPLDKDSRQVVVCDEGTNTVVVEDGAVHIEDADCSGGDCMKQGAIDQPGNLLVCLPHQLIVEIVPAERAGSREPSVYTGREQVGADDIDVVAR